MKILKGSSPHQIKIKPPQFVLNAFKWIIKISWTCQLYCCGKATNRGMNYKKCVFRAKSQLKMLFSWFWKIVLDWQWNHIIAILSAFVWTCCTLSLLTSAQIFHFDLKKNSWQQPTASQFHNNAHSYVHVILCAINCQFIFSIIIVSAATAAVHRSLFFLFFLGDKLHKNLYLFCLVMAYKMNITIMSVLSSEASEWVRVTQLTQFFTTSMWWLEIMLKKSSKKNCQRGEKLFLKNPPTATHVTKEINYRLIQKKLLPSVYNFYK